MKLSRRAALTALAALPVIAACGGPVAERRRIRIATGSPTAVYHAVGNAFAVVLRREMPEAGITVLATAASAANVQLILSGRAEIGFTQADILAVEGGPTPGIVALARVYDDLMHLIVPASSPIRTLDDLRGRRVSVGARGSGTAVTIGRLLSVARQTVERRELGLDASVDALSRGDIDAFFFSGGLPTAGIQRLSERTPIRIVDLSAWAGPLREAYSEVYVVRNVAASAYKLPAVATVAVPNLLVVSTKMANGLAFDLTRLLLERRDELAAAHPAAEGLDIRSAIATLPVPLHPGAAAYFRKLKP